MFHWTKGRRPLIPVLTILAQTIPRSAWKVKLSKDLITQKKGSVSILHNKFYILAKIAINTK